VRLAMDEITIGARLRTLRRWRGRTQTELVGRSGLTQSFVSMVENGNRGMRQGVIADSRRSRAVVEALRAHQPPRRGELSDARVLVRQRGIPCLCSRASPRAMAAEAGGTPEWHFEWQIGARQRYFWPVPASVS
jgi:Helix-turn-helix domain